MAVVALVGGQWGEEDSGRLAEILSENARVVARAGSGPARPVRNNYGGFVLQYLPRSIFNPRTITLLGAGLTLDPRQLLDEIESLKKAGVDLSRLYVSEQAHLIMPYHHRLAEAEGQAAGISVNNRVCGQAQGPAPGPALGLALADKYNGTGLRLGDLLQEEALLARLSKALSVKNEILSKVYGRPPLVLPRLYQEYLGYGRELREHIFDTRLILQRSLERGYPVLLENDRGTLLDVDFGAYPYVSNTTTTVGAAATLGIPPSAISGVIGVFGAYIACPGDGPLPTEMSQPESEKLSAPVSEAGQTLRFGWFDAVAARYAGQLNGLSSIALTGLAGLDGFETVRICTDYTAHEVNLKSYPAGLETLRAVRPVYREMPGWQTSTRQVTSFAGLPPACQNFVVQLQYLLGSRIDLILTGPEREDVITLRDPFQTFLTAR